MNSLGKRLFWSIGLPSFLVTAAGVGVLSSTSLVAFRSEHALGELILFAAVLAAAIALSLNVLLTRPLRRLAAAMRRAEAGDFLVRAEVDRADEIGQLSLAFNQMLARITAMKADEIDIHRDLEAAQEELELKKALETRVNELSLLYDVARSLNATLELPELLVRIGTLVSERLKIPRFSVMVLSPDNQLEVKIAFPSGGIEGMVFEIGEGAGGLAAQQLKTVYIADIEKDRDVYVRRSKNEKGSLLSIPMIHKEALLGVLNLERPLPNAFAPEEKELLTAVADQAAMAVKNARLHEEMVALSLTDPLTGIPNRRHLFSRLEMEIARAHRFNHPVSVVLVDIDHFKYLNDHSGHRAGDDCLRQVSDLMRKMVRKIDTLARYGGEEFMLVLPQVTKHEAFEVAEKLRKAIEEMPCAYGPHQPFGKLTISSGVSSLGTDASDLGSLVDCSDAALYASKRNGRNKSTVYSVGMELHPGRERGPHVASIKPKISALPEPAA